MPRLIAPLVVALAVGTSAVPASAHHTAASLGTVRITTPVMAGGVVLQPGIYELRDTGQHGKPLPGQSAEAQARVEFVQNGMVVATDIAEVMVGAIGPVGTSGGASRLRFERLKDGNFARVSGTHNGERYLVHLPLRQ